MTNPCKDCPDRHAICHDSCEKFKEWREFHTAENKRMKQQNAACSISKNAFQQEFWMGRRWKP